MRAYGKLCGIIWVEFFHRKISRFDATDYFCFFEQSVGAHPFGIDALSSIQPNLLLLVPSCVVLIAIFSVLKLLDNNFLVLVRPFQMQGRRQTNSNR